MGADLYIAPLYFSQREHWKPLFDEAVRQSASFPAGSEEHDMAVARQAECFERMHERGYFRDPYNDWDLLWKFGLSWWNDVIPMLNPEEQLPVAQTKRLLAILEAHEDIFAMNLAQLSVEDREYFRSSYTDFKRFLNQGIELDEPIDTWL